MFATKTRDNEDGSDHTLAEENDVIFGGFEHRYNEVLETEGRCLCPDVQAQTGNDYKEMKNFFEHFQRKLKQVIWKQNAKEKITCIS